MHTVSDLHECKCSRDRCAWLNWWVCVKGLGGWGSYVGELDDSIGFDSDVVLLELLFDLIDARRDVFGLRRYKRRGQSRHWIRLGGVISGSKKKKKKTKQTKSEKPGSTEENNEQIWSNQTSFFLLTWSSIKSTTTIVNMRQTNPKCAF